MSENLLHNIPICASRRKDIVTTKAREDVYRSGLDYNAGTRGEVSIVCIASNRHQLEQIVGKFESIVLGAQHSQAISRCYQTLIFLSGKHYLQTLQQHDQKVTCSISSELQEFLAILIRKQIRIPSIAISDVLN